ncbi:hypothetical protein [Streptomyces sp. NPDC001315]|uniref:hypothetical protein n=1 Tax=Streptomyces sp. NPDC001315 TaxID=3364562 RepID=UPI0036AE8D20
MSMREPPKPYNDLSMSELAEWVGDLDRSDAVSRVEIHMTLAEVYTRLGNAPEGSDARLLDGLRKTLDRLLQREDDRTMRRPWFRRGDDMPPRNCGGMCMCSIERLEDRTKRDD